MSNKKCIFKINVTFFWFYCERFNMFVYSNFLTFIQLIIVKTHLNQTIIMKKLLLLSLFLSSILLLQAQRKVVYEYDNSGNRIKRQVIVLNTKQAKPAEKQDTVAEILSHVEVTAYPNPVKGTLHVEIKGQKEDEKARISLFGSQGTLVFNKETSEPYNPIDFNNYLPGVYILQVYVGDKKTEIKIIKQ